MSKDSFKVDRNNLEEEWESNPQTGYDFEKGFADAREERDTARRLMDLALAEAIDHVRINYEDYSLTKQHTNSSTYVRSVAVQSEDYQAKYKVFIKKEHTVNVLQGRSYAMLAKRASLDNLTKLFLAGYYSTDTQIPDQRKDAIQEKKSQHEHQETLAKNPRLKRRTDGHTDNNR